MSDDPFRYCVYCGADCYVDAWEREHKNDCPMVTGLYPVREQDLGPACTHCGKRSMGMRCWICEEEFKVGDVYVHLDGDEKPIFPAPGIEGAHFAGIVTCVGCAAQREAA